MTRSQLLKIAYQISRNPKDRYPFMYGSYIKTGLHMKKPMFVVFDMDNNLLALSYNHVCYFLSQLSASQAKITYHFYNDRNCDTKVFLYPYRYMFRDSDGIYDDANDKRFAKHCDYANLIPIPM